MASEGGKSRPKWPSRAGRRSGATIDLQFFVVNHYSGELDNHIFNALQWSSLSALPTYDFLAADYNLIRDLADGKLL